MTYKNIKAKAARLGLCLTVTTPGDRYGRRYRFEKPKGIGIGYCAGAREAEVFLEGYAVGLFEVTP